VTGMGGPERAPGAPPRDWRRVAFAMFAVGWGANQFSSMLVAYRDELGFGAGTLAALFGVYALGLVPGLLLGGPASDRFGRRPLVLTFVALSPVATLLLMLGHDAELGLAIARLLAGLCSGVVFAAGSAWVQELSILEADGTGSRRAALALTAGFGSGPVIAAMVAEVAPHPLVLPYVPHVLLGTAALVLLLPAAETAPAAHGRLRLTLPAAVRSRSFRRLVAPTAPWVFACAAISFAVLPARTGDVTVAFSGLVTGITLGAGVAIQPFARRTEDAHPLRAGLFGLAAAIAGTLAGFLAIQQQSPLLVLVAAFPLGAGYGLCLVSGLRESERLARPEERGATLAVFYALTYIGFAAPYLLALVARATGTAEALLVATAAAALTAVVVLLAARAEHVPA
jgi:predicted MFS family arabinose efflux permease